MEKLITVKDVKERYGCSTPTARKYIRQCNPHLEDPLVTYEWAFHAWETSRVKYVFSTSKQEKTRLEKQMTEGRTIVPRRR